MLSKLHLARKELGQVINWRKGITAGTRFVHEGGRKSPFFGCAANNEWGSAISIRIMVRNQYRQMKQKRDLQSAERKRSFIVIGGLDRFHFLGSLAGQGLSREAYEPMASSNGDQNCILDVDLLLLSQCCVSRLLLTRRWRHWSPYCCSHRQSRRANPRFGPVYISKHDIKDQIKPAFVG